MPGASIIGHGVGRIKFGVGRMSGA
jgi:hypothetical protein